MAAIARQQIRTGGGVAPLDSFSPAPSGAFLRLQSTSIDSTDTRPVGRMAMLETTTLLVVASPARPVRLLLRAGFSLALRCHATEMSMRAERKSCPWRRCKASGDMAHRGRTAWLGWYPPNPIDIII
jgi:hypothetical protein